MQKSNAKLYTRITHMIPTTIKIDNTLPITSWMTIKNNGSSRKSILVTGVNGNIGEAISKLFNSYGWNVSEILGKEQINLSRRREVSSFVQTMSGTKFDIVAMPHGVQKTRTLIEMTDDVWSWVIDNNLTSSQILISELLKAHLISTNGLIVFFSSIQATQPRSGRAAYAVAKAGIEALARVTSVENSDIRSIALRIGQMTKPMKGIKFSESQMTLLESKIPKPWVDASDIANLVYSLYEQPSIRGEVIEVSSGHKFSIW